MCSLEKRGNVFVLTLTGPGEHRLNPTLMTQIHSALAQVNAKCSATSSSSSALVTTAEGKFFSNGFDLDWALSTGGHVIPARVHQLDSALRSLVAAFAALPIPTVAAITGHACAAGLVLALAHDHVAARRDRGFMYMSELDIGLRVPRWFVAIIRGRVGAPAARRRVLLEAAKVTGDEAVKMGLADSAHDGDEGTVAAAVAKAEGLAEKGWDGGVYAHTRSELLSEVLDEIKAVNNNSSLSLSKM